MGLTPRPGAGASRLGLAGPETLEATRVDYVVTIVENTVARRLAEPMTVLSARPLTIQQVQHIYLILYGNEDNSVVITMRVCMNFSGYRSTITKIPAGEHTYRVLQLFPAPPELSKKPAMP